MAALVYRNGRFAVRFGVLREDGVDIHDEPRREARLFGAAPPPPATYRSEQATQVCSTRQFESPLREDTTLRSLPNVEGRPCILSQHLLQPQLIGAIQGALSLKPSGHELGNVAVFGDGHADHRPLRHRGIMLVALESPRILSNL